MNHTNSYSDIVDINYEANDVRSAEIDSLKDELLTGILNEGEAFGWSFSDLLGYLSEEGITVWEEWTRQTLRGGCETVVNTAFNTWLDKAAEEVATKIYEEEK